MSSWHVKRKAVSAKSKAKERFLKQLQARGFEAIHGARLAEKAAKDYDDWYKNGWGGDEDES